jgi:transposase
VETRNTSSGGRTRKVSKPRVAFTIECHKEKQDTLSYNAEYIAQNIREKYGL